MNSFDEDNSVQFRAKISLCDYQVIYVVYIGKNQIDEENNCAINKRVLCVPPKIAEKEKRNVYGKRCKSIEIEFWYLEISNNSFSFRFGEAEASFVIVALKCAHEFEKSPNPIIIYLLPIDMSTL